MPDTIKGKGIITADLYRIAVEIKDGDQAHYMMSSSHKGSYNKERAQEIINVDTKYVAINTRFDILRPRKKRAKKGGKS